MKRHTKTHKKPNLSRIDYVRKYKIGTRYMTELGSIFKYVKMDLGVAGKINGKIRRIIQYVWIQVRL